MWWKVNDWFSFASVKWDHSVGDNELCHFPMYPITMGNRASYSVICCDSLIYKRIWDESGTILNTNHKIWSLYILEVSKNIQNDWVIFIWTVCQISTRLVD